MIQDRVRDKGEVKDNTGGTWMGSLTFRDSRAGNAVLCNSGDPRENPAGISPGVSAGAEMPFIWGQSHKILWQIWQGKMQQRIPLGGRAHDT